MPRLIDADALRDTLDRYLHAPHVQVGNSIGQGMRIAIKACIELLDNERTIDPESLRPHGRWVQNGQCEHKPGRIKNTDHWTTYKCSVCGASNGRWKRHNYCHNCGAKMDEEDNNA